MRKLMIVAALALVTGLMALNGGALAGNGKPGSFNNAGGVDEWLFDPGFDQFGYNYRAHVFSGMADGVDRNLDGTVWGDATFANDQLVMKWSDEWLTYVDSNGDGKLDRGFLDCRGAGTNAGLNESHCPGAWLTNEWNGMAPDGSQTVEHLKIVYSPGCLTSGTPSPGAYCVWGAFEVVMDQGVDPTTGHFWAALSKPNGFGTQ